MPLGETDQALRQIEGLLGQGDGPNAERAARSLMQAQPGSLEAHVLLGHAQRLSGKADEALATAKTAAAMQPDHPAPAMLIVDLLHESGQRVACIAALKTLAARTGDPPVRLLQDVAQRFAVLGLHAEAEQCHARARQLQPGHPELIYNHATSLIALGRLAEAEAALDQVIAMRPEDSDAWYNRATLRKQTVDQNHVEAIESQLAKTPPAAPGRVALGYALAKELEDLGDPVRSFAALKQGADLRRRMLSYRVEEDLETMQLIAQAFDADFFAREHAGHADARPLFIIGLPRSGTTLVDRILSSHTDVTSRGEVSDLAMALVKGAGKVSGKAEMVRRSTTLDFRMLGGRYCAHLPEGEAVRYLDKTPVNFLYLGLIAAALPNARVIHLRRNPMDVCYAMYKTLFRMAYPFSYDLGDLARYWIGYDRLMRHWRAVFPASRLLEIDYEDLVANQEQRSRELVAFAGLSWQDACLSFEKNPQPSLTASAAQVRQPMYRSSVGLWRRHENELAPLRDLLIEAGIEIESHPTGHPQ
ncbi:sulfotransferase [Dokdonella sp.]|uniref:tetratricopeptide repeat-containing sulfotransferase family protein n=1 Tax=Dokdonella sp. TaxID=2291710 RepID=UPI0035271588